MSMNNYLEDTAPTPGTINYAVLTGDLVSSRNINARQYDTVLYQLEQLLNHFRQDLDCSYNFYRGDAFQILLPRTEEAISLALYIRLTLIAIEYDTRLSIGIGEVSNLRQDVKSATGQAFTLSGTGLDQLASDQRLALYCQDQQLQDILAIPVRMADSMISKLTVRQAEALLLYLLPPEKSHEQIAAQLGTTRANVTKLLNNNNADYQLIKAFLKYCKMHVTRRQP